MAYRPSLLMIALAIALTLTVANAQLSANGTNVASVTVIGTVGCNWPQLNLVTPYLSCAGGATSVANGTFVTARGLYNIMLLNVFGANPIAIDAPPCAVFIRLPIPNCGAFPQSSGLIKADLTGLRIRAAGAGLAGFVALFRARRLSVVA